MKQLQKTGKQSNPKFYRNLKGFVFQAFALIVLLLFIFMGVSCNRNRLKTDEKALTKQILTEEEQLAHEQTLREEREKHLADSIAKLPKGFRFPENRSIDPQNPPVVIDIAGNIDRTKEFKLSDIVKSIKYIRLQPPTDSAFVGKLINEMQFRKDEKLLKEELPFSITKNKDFMVASNYLGMLLYDSDGKLLSVICKNEFTGMQLSKEGISGSNKSTFKGAHSTPRLVKNRLYYIYEDDARNTSKMMEVRCNELPLPIPLNNENQNTITGLGDPVASTGKNSYSAVPLGNSIYSKTGHPKRQEDMLTIYNSNGDTLCSFKGNQKVENYSKSVSRTPDFGSRFFYQDYFYFREAHSDTLFMVIPPNSLIPSFIIDFGEYKIEKLQQAMDPGFDLSNKFLLKSLSITKNQVFIHYTKGYNSPNARKNKLVNFFYAIYDRSKNELWHASTDSFNWNYGLENDLDGGLPFWPGMGSAKYYANSSITDNGEILLSVKGKYLKEHISTETFKNSSAPVQKKEELIELANQLNDNETIVVVMK